MWHKEGTATLVQAAGCSLDFTLNTNYSQGKNFSNILNILPHLALSLYLPVNLAEVYYFKNTVFGHVMLSANVSFCQLDLRMSHHDMIDLGMSLVMIITMEITEQTTFMVHGNTMNSVIELDPHNSDSVCFGNSPVLF